MQIGIEAQRAVKNRRVFVVDDDDINRTVLQFMLADGNETHELQSIAAAEREGEQWRPDLVIVAAILVASQEPDLIGRWRARWPELTVLVICEACDDACVAAAKQAGADDTLTRPFKLDAVRRKVDHWLDCGIDLKDQVAMV